MKINIAIAFLLISSQAISQDHPALLKPKSPFTESGTLLNGVEDGSINGVSYSFYYSDGSGSFSGLPNGDLSRESNWSTSCKKDSMNDKKSCFLYKKGLWVWLYQGEGVKVSIGGDHYPGTSATIRIDSKPSIKSPSSNEGVFTSSQSKQIIRQLIEGNSVSTRYVNWPYHTSADESFELSGFNETYKYIQWAIKQIR